MVNLLNVENYWAYWYGLRESCSSDIEAWETAENKMNQLYGVGQYDSYDAFRIAKSRYRHILIDKIGAGQTSMNTIADILTVPGYMSAFYEYRSQQCDLSDREAWEHFEEFINNSYFVKIYSNYDAFRKARTRYVQSISKIKHRIWKTRKK